MFGQTPYQVAADFRNLLAGDAPFAGAFETIVFAILDPWPEAQAFEAFRRHFRDGVLGIGPA